MTVLASIGSKINVKNRQAKLESDIIERGKSYEILYDIEGTLSRTEALALVLEIRRQSYKSSDYLKFGYAEVTSGSSQNLRFQFKGLKSSGSPFIFTLGLTFVICMAAAALVVTIGYLMMRGIDVIEGVTEPFIPQTVYKCPIDDNTFQTYEGLVQHYGEEHPDVIPPSPEETETTENPWMLWIILGVAVIATIVIIYIFVMRR